MRPTVRGKAASAPSASSGPGRRTPCRPDESADNARSPTCQQIAVFLDRDGTINHEVHYLASPEQVTLLPGAVKGLVRLREAGLKLVVITNQAGVARGYLSEQDVLQVHERLQEMLSEHGAGVHAFYYCPHHPDGQGIYRRACPCRKPGTAMYERAARDMGLDLARSYVVGDKVTDLIPGLELGCRTVLVRTGYGQSLLEEGALEGVAVDYVADTLEDAADWILQHSRGRDV